MNVNTHDGQCSAPIISENVPCAHSINTAHSQCGTQSTQRKKAGQPGDPGTVTEFVDVSFNGDLQNQSGSSAVFFL